MRHNKPSLQLAPNDETMEEMLTPHTAGTWEQHIINHLISYFNVGDLELIKVTSSSDWEGSDEDEPVLCNKCAGKYAELKCEYWVGKSEWGSTSFWLQYIYTKLHYLVVTNNK